MMLIPPATQFSRGYTFATPSAGFTSDFANIVALADEAAAGGVVLDGKPIDPMLFSPMPGSPYAGAQVTITVGAHVVSSRSPFRLYVYGFGRFNSYGYPGGFSLGAH
jgi:adhesin/invasin